jgi:hypothetical protein
MIAAALATLTVVVAPGAERSWVSPQSIPRSVDWTVRISGHDPVAEQTGRVVWVYGQGVVVRATHDRRIRLRITNLAHTTKRIVVQFHLENAPG